MDQYNERVNNEADDHANLMQQQREFVAAMQLKKRREKRCLYQSVIKYQTYKPSGWDKKDD